MTGQKNEKNRGKGEKENCERHKGKNRMGVLT
jgi:hypothetical protein